ncbi:hypothetical protein ACVIHH_001057 [Bradyrhizobium sp. USDA 4518]
MTDSNDTMRLEPVRSDFALSTFGQKTQTL